MKTCVGIDIGSTTVKLVVAQGKEILYKCYERHFSQVRQKTVEMMRSASQWLQGKRFAVAISGSAGLGVAKAGNIDFIQEVYATGEAVKQLEPGTDVVVELGGEDAKIIFLTGGLEERMNGSCAGGTGAFIDQMASLLAVDADELDRMALQYEKIYPIASRCGVFAKSDIQPLLNQGAKKEDIAASIYQAVVNQTITGLAQGRRIKGKVLFLGGPLYFCKGLQQRFVETLGLDEQHAVFPPLGQYVVAIGTAMFAASQKKDYDFDELIHTLESAVGEGKSTRYLEPLFANEDDYKAFLQRHEKETVPTIPIENYSGNAYLGIDCGSTTTKVVLIDEKANLLYEYYNSNRGNPVQIIKEQLTKLYELCGERIHIAASAVTGYGEELIKNAFGVDFGLVETMAHFKAARHFNPKVDFILDIGGQDMKCFKVKDNSIDSIMLNEACSSGCGSFIETFARSMGYDVKTFAQKGLFSQYPVDLGSRCTVFMNSSVKQAQKEGAGVEDISAGLSMSVVKNAIYKVIRANSADELGQNIVVQGGTFLNDAILRSFEKELGRDVIRPRIAGLMGAYGAALHARSLRNESSSLLSKEELQSFEHTSSSATCKGCANNCSLTINRFSGGRKFISGNKCEKGLGLKTENKLPNLYQYKLHKILSLKPGENKRGRVGLPLGLNMYENLPFWHSLFTSLGYEVVVSDPSTHQLYASGQYSIASDTECYPAKLMHGHIENLLSKQVDFIFYPCLSYNFDEHKGDNHYNCPVVAYYPELLHANVEKLQNIKYLYPYLGIHKKESFLEKSYAFFCKELGKISYRDYEAAVDKAYADYDAWMKDIKAEGARALKYAKENGLRVIVLAGRPYHVDPEVNHGIDKLIGSFGIVVVSEDCVSDLVSPQKVHVLNQWTYHSRLYNAAKYVTLHDRTELVQLVSFGCGIDAITTDEVREILERDNKLYTQLKIDEITNLGAVKIRIRSLLEAVEERERNKIEANEQ